MDEPIAVLMVEDSEDDALLTALELRRGGFELTLERVETADGFQAALNKRQWDVIISDYRLPRFDAPTALNIFQQNQLDCPFIIVSGTIGEEVAVAMMKAGAHDYLMKGNLARLPEAVRREVREATMRDERRQADIQLRQTAEREQLIRLMTERIRRSLDLEDILITTVTEVRQILQTDRVVLLKLNSNEWGYIAKESVGEGWRAIAGQDVYDPCFHTTYVEKYVQGRVHTISDIDDGSVEPCHAELLRQFQVRANLIVPVLQPKAPWGLLIAHHCSQPRHWTEGEIQLLRQLADQVAIAIQQANLYQQSQSELAERQRAEAALKQLNQELEQRVRRRTQTLQRQANQEHLLRLIIQNIHQSLNIDDIFSTVLRETRKTLEADRVTIYQFNADWSGQFIAESVGEGWSALVGDDGQFVWTDSYLQDTQGGRYKNNETFTVPDIYESGHDQCHIALLEQFQARAYAIVPIILDSQLWGLLAAYQNTGPRQWQDWEISLLHQISIQMAIALRQSLLYQASREQVTELEKLHQLKDDFLSTVSHELRSPLANIKMAIQMLDISLAQPELQLDRLTHYLQILEEECNQELALVNDLLDLQRLETGRHSLDMERLDLTHWISSVAESFQVRAQQQQQHLRINISPHLSPIETDPDCLKRIVVELLHNACKYTPPHERILVTAQESHQMLQIKVCNSGVEIPADKLPYIFEKFYRITGADRWKHGGTGLGLALVKCLVEHLGGTIAATSANALTCFTIQLPMSVQEVTPYSALAEEAGGLSSAT